MNILLLGGGGREHALAWKLKASPMAPHIFVAPGNPGMNAFCHAVALDITAPADVVAMARADACELVVIGPEAPLAAGVADACLAAGVRVFGPTRAAARLETSKAFTKDLCAELGVPTAAYRHFTNRAAALAYAAAHALPVVVKADGLAAGKGVTVAHTHAAACAAVEGALKAAGDGVVVEAFLDGEEASLFVLSDGTTAVPFGSARDYKRVGDGDTGPNTGGMGAVSPAPALTGELQARAMAEIVTPVLDAMRARGTPYRGILYAGLMLTGSGPQLIEFNARFGDPEAQVLMPRLNEDLLALMLAAAEGRLADRATEWSAEPACAVVLAAEGYPAAPRLGDPVTGLAAAAADGALLFHAGTRMTDDLGLVSSGGRVLSAVATGPDARARAYAALRHVALPGGFYRRDIGLPATVGDGNQPA